MSERLFIWAHRGASAVAPENTLAAFAAALAAGADGIELDVQITRDGVPVVLHDDRLDRTTDRCGRVRALTLRQVRQADAGGWFHAGFRGERVPTLQEVLDWAGDAIALNLEIKDAAVAGAVLALLRLYPAARVLVSSFDYRLLRRLRLAAPQLELAVLSDRRLWHGALREAVRLGARALHPRQDRFSAVMASLCRQRRLQVCPWTVDDPSAMRRLLRQGADGFFTNDPAAARRLLETVDG